MKIGLVTMRMIPIDAYPANVQRELCELDLKIRPVVSAQKMWDRSFDESARTRLGGSFQQAYLQRGTIGMWMDAFGVSPIRALIDLSCSVDLLSPQNRAWLLRETGESDGSSLLQSAIESGALVLTEERHAYFGGVDMTTDWYRHEKSWNLLWELSRRSKRGQNLDYFDLGERATSKTLRDRKHRLKPLIPPGLFDLIRQERGSGCRIDLEPSLIRLFVETSDGELIEWTGWEPASA